MAGAPDRRVVTAAEPILLLVAVAVFGAILICGLISGWVWIPGSTRGSGVGYWASREENLGNYAVYLVIMGAATLGVLAMALDRLARFNAQDPGRSGRR